MKPWHMVLAAVKCDPHGLLLPRPETEDSYRPACRGHQVPAPSEDQGPTASSGTNTHAPVLKPGVPQQSLHPHNGPSLDHPL